MAGLDDLIGSLTNAQQQGGSVGSGLDDLLGGLLGGGDGGQGGGADLGGLLGGLLGGGQDAGAQSGGAGGTSGLASVIGVLGPMIASFLANGGLSKLLAGMQAQGLSAQADSWVGTGPNQQIAPDDLRHALGEEQVAQVAEQLGTDPDTAAQLLAQITPNVVNAVTPDGQLPDDAELDRLAGVLQSYAQ